jgi:tRNA(His) guanylyltransferase
MANSKFEYVKKFEQSNVLLPSTFIVVRLDGRGFTPFTDAHGFEKPNDIRGLKLMNKAAKEVMKNFTDIIIAYGESDEYSLVFKKSTKVFNRREDKILSTVTSLFSTSYVFYFPKFFPGV